MGLGVYARWPGYHQAMPQPSYPTPTSAAVTAVMRGNRKADTRPEVLLRSALHRRGLRFRKNHAIVTPELRVTADVVFPGRQLSVFVDGCFWHSCPEHGTRPRSNTDYWDAKLARNIARDRRVESALAAAGWTVIRVWEHEDPATTAALIGTKVEA